MSQSYGVVYSKRQQALFECWAEIDPVSESEIAHHEIIKRVQGYGLILKK